MEASESAPREAYSDQEYWNRHNYWLSHCEGFRVEDSSGRRLGRVAAVGFGNRRTDRPEDLIIRSGRVRLHWSVVETDEVAVIVPHDMRLRVRRTAHDPLPMRRSPMDYGLSGRSRAA